MKKSILVRELNENDYLEFRALRQSHLDNEPQSVGTVAKDFKEAPKEKVIALLHKPIDSQNFIMGSFVGRELVGMLGFKRDTRKSSILHKATLWGYYVKEEHRNQGVGRSLALEVMNRGKTLDWCEMIRVMISSTDKSAIHIAKSLGFEHYGTERKSRKINGQYFDDCYFARYFGE